MSPESRVRAIPNLAILIAILSSACKPGRTQPTPNIIATQQARSAEIDATTAGIFEEAMQEWGVSRAETIAWQKVEVRIYVSPTDELGDVMGIVSGVMDSAWSELNAVAFQLDPQQPVPDSLLSGQQIYVALAPDSCVVDDPDAEPPRALAPLDGRETPPACVTNSLYARGVTQTGEFSNVHMIVATGFSSNPSCPEDQGIRLTPLGSGGKTFCVDRFQAALGGLAHGFANLVHRMLPTFPIPHPLKNLSRELLNGHVEGNVLERYLGLEPLPSGP